MPQLDIVSFLTQYFWVLLSLFILFCILINTILPRMQQQLAIRRAELSSLSKVVKPQTSKPITESDRRLEVFKKIFK